MAIRGFYLDLAQWALDDPARWGPWAVPCPVRTSDIQYKKQKSRTKARMDARTRERLPVMPALAASVDRERRDAAARLDAARATPPGVLFTAGGQTLLRARLTRTTQTTRIWAEEPSTGKRRDLTREEDNAFWAWAAVEVLRHTGIRLRGTDGTLAPQPGPVPAPVNRRAGPAAVSRPVQDRPGTAPRHRPGTGRRPVRHRHPGPQ